LEQRAFRYLLDLDAYTEFSSEIVQALEPDPFDVVVAQRYLEGQSCPSRRYHPEKIRPFQGIDWTFRTTREQTAALIESAVPSAQGLKEVRLELSRRPRQDLAASDDTLAAELLKLVTPIVNKKNPSWDTARMKEPPNPDVKTVCPRYKISSNTCGSKPLPSPTGNSARF